MLLHVTRSTFSSEKLAAVCGVDALIPRALTLHEFACGPLSSPEARRRREEGGLAFRTILTVDAMSLFAAVAANTVRTPSEKSLAGHLFWLCELLDRRILSGPRWSDTRDMSADFHTKGGVARDMVLRFMLGLIS